MPTSITVYEKKLGPADWVRAALTLLCGCEDAIVIPDKWQIDLNEFPVLCDYCFKDTWMNSPELDDKYLFDRSRLQA